MHNSGGNLGEVTVRSNQKDLETFELAGKPPCAACLPYVYRLPATKPECLQRGLAVCATSTLSRTSIPVDSFRRDRAHTTLGRTGVSGPSYCGA